MTPQSEKWADWAFKGVLGIGFALWSLVVLEGMTRLAVLEARIQSQKIPPPWFEQKVEHNSIQLESISARLTAVQLEIKELSAKLEK